MTTAEGAPPYGDAPSGSAIARDQWLATHPKAKLYVDFGDFGFVRLRPLSAFLNGGFGRAVRLAPDDLMPPRA